MLELLLKKGAQLESCDKAGKTALFIAAANQFTDCLDLLIQYGADVNGGTQVKRTNYNIDTINFNVSYIIILGKLGRYSSFPSHT